MEKVLCIGWGPAGRPICWPVRHVFYSQKKKKKKYSRSCFFTNCGQKPWSPSCSCFSRLARAQPTHPCRQVKCDGNHRRSSILLRFGRERNGRKAKTTRVLHFPSASPKMNFWSPSRGVPNSHFLMVRSTFLDANSTNLVETTTNGRPLGRA